MLRHARSPSFVLEHGDTRSCSLKVSIKPYGIRTVEGQGARVRAGLQCVGPADPKWRLAGCDIGKSTNRFGADGSHSSAAEISLPGQVPGSNCVCLKRALEGQFSDRQALKM